MEPGSDDESFGLRDPHAVPINYYVKRKGFHELGPFCVVFQKEQQRRFFEDEHEDDFPQRQADQDGYWLGGSGSIRNASRFWGLLDSCFRGNDNY